LDTRTKILEVSRELFMSYGLKSVSMDDISRKLGMSKKTIYQYVANKDELVKEVIGHFLLSEHEIIKNIIAESSDAIDEYLSLSRHFLSTVKKMKPTISFDLQKYYPESWQIIEKNHFSFLQTIIFKNIQDGIKEKLYRENVNADIISKLYISENHAMANEDLFPNEQYPRHELLIEFVRYHISGIASESGLKRMKEILKAYK
jgi:AcrR family transcriptional regulator